MGPETHNGSITGLAVEVCPTPKTMCFLNLGHSHATFAISASIMCREQSVISSEVARCGLKSTDQVLILDLPLTAS